MTLILAMANDDYTVLVSDRRLTRNGTPFEDESNKAAVLICENARLAVAFTGVAEVGSFMVRRWLLEALTEAAAPDYLMGPTIARFRDRATSDIGRLKVGAPSHKRLTVVLAGYHYGEDPPRPYCWFVSNFEEADPEKPSQDEPAAEFTASFSRAKDPAEGKALVRLAGTTAGVRGEDADRLHALLLARRPPEAVVGKAVEALRTAADSPASQGFVGKQATSIIVPMDPGRSVESEYHTAIATRKVYTPSHIQARADAAFIVAEPETWTEDATGEPTVSAVPKVGRNRPCPCGSGLKYKKCHGEPRKGGGVLFGE